MGMRTAPITTVDLSKLAGLRAYPLGEVRDVRSDAPDFSLDGVIAPSEVFAYQLVLVPGLNYRLADFAPGPAFSAMLVDADSGEVLWANASGLDRLGVDRARARDQVQVGEDQAVVLVVEGVGDADAPFVVSADARPIDPDDFAVYRFLNKGNGQHFITAWEFERDYVLANMPHMQYQGESFFAADVPLEGFVPVYRFANLINGSYFFTAYEAERQSVQDHYSFMRFEGAAFYVPDAPGEESVPVYRLANLKTGGYLYTPVLAEKAFYLLSGDWRDEGFSFYAIDPAAVAALAVETQQVAAGAEVSLLGVAPELPG